MNVNREIFEKGIKSFNEGNYFEAHETWEDQWHGIEKSPEKYFIQGLIMIAVALHNYNRKNYTGTSKLLGKGMKLLKELEGLKTKINLADFLKEIVVFQEKVKSSQKCISDMEFPRIKRL